MRSLVVVLAIGVGCGGGSGSSGGDAGPHWTFTATVNGMALDLSAAGGAYITTGSTPLFRAEGDDIGSCQHTLSFDLPQQLAVQTYNLGAQTGGASDAFGTYHDCNLATGAATDDTHTGTVTITRTDGSCALPPCIDATFQFTALYSVGTTMQTFQVTNGHVSDY